MISSHVKGQAHLDMFALYVAQSPATTPNASALPSSVRHDEFLIVALCFVAVLLVIWPLGRFLFREWSYRRELIFGALAGDAVVYYYKQFRPGAKALTDVKEKEPDSKNTGCKFGSEFSESYLKAFKQDFYRWYGKRYYFAPVLGVIALTCVCAYWAEEAIRLWARSGGPKTDLRALVGAALAGAFVWVISDEIERLRKRDFVTSDIYYYVFRILLAVPFAWAIAAISIQGQVLGMAASIPVAFFLGAFPTETLFKIARRFGSQQLKLGDDQATGSLELEKLQAVGKTSAERFNDEGIYTITALAHADPIDLTIRTNFGFRYVVDSVSQALAWLYFQDNLTKLSAFSLGGAKEIHSVLKWAGDNTDADRQYRANQAIADAAKKLDLSVDAFRTTLDLIAIDPYTQFLVNVVVEPST